MRMTRPSQSYQHIHIQQVGRHQPSSSRFTSSDVKTGLSSRTWKTGKSSTFVLSYRFPAIKPLRANSEMMAPSDFSSCRAIAFATLKISSSRLRVVLMHTSLHHCIMMSNITFNRDIEVFQSLEFSVVDFSKDWKLLLVRVLRAQPHSRGGSR